MSQPPDITALALPGDDGRPEDDPDEGRFDRLTPAGSFVFDRPEHTPAIWGEGDQILWAKGESLLIAGEQGVGKTTIAGLLVRGCLGLDDEVLGLPVRQNERRVLYLAMDRPQQAGRSLMRQFSDDERHFLDMTVSIWPGPPPADFAVKPEILRELAGRAEADIVELHHMTKKAANQVKGGALAGVYGSVLLTAGAGSVVLLDGAPGSTLVTLHHLKQPAAPVGPLPIRHDHATGRASRHTGNDLLAAAADGPVTAKEAALIRFAVEVANSAQVEVARRELEKLEQQGLLVREGGGRGGAGGSRTTTWRLPDYSHL